MRNHFCVDAVSPQRSVAVRGKAPISLRIACCRIRAALGRCIAIGAGPRICEVKLQRRLARCGLASAAFGA